MKIAITGGKGGAGKSTVATALALELRKTKKVLLVDADVECPNDHLILSIKRKKIKEIFQSIPKFNRKKCIKCGLCAKVCRENAIVFVKGRYPIFVPDLCIGCKACLISCPAKAIEEEKKKIGTIYFNKSEKIDLLSAETEIGYEEAGIIVNRLKEFLHKIEKNYDYVLVDTAPGTHCNVIAALKDSDLALVVTEPTPLGKHDLELILKLIKSLGIKARVIINKANIGNKKIIEKILRKYKTEVIAEIPYRKSILKAYSSGKQIKDKAIQKIAEWLRNQS